MKSFMDHFICSSFDRIAQESWRAVDRQLLVDGDGGVGRLTGQVASNSDQ
jgi:hypothetical protein